MPKIIFDSDVPQNALSTLLEGYLSGLGEVCHTLFGAKGEAVMYEAVGDAFKRYLKKKQGIDFTKSEPWERYCEVVEFFTSHGFYSHVELDAIGENRYWMLESGQYAGNIWEEQKSWERGTPPCPLWAIIVCTQAEIGYRVVLDEVDFRAEINGYESTFHFEKFHPGSEGILVRALREIRESIHATYMLNMVADHTSDAIYLKDLEGRYLFANKAVSLLVNKPIEEILGHDDNALFPPAAVENIRESDREVVRSDSVMTYEEAITFDGVTRTFSTTKGIYRDAEGKQVGMFGISRDISDRKCKEVELYRVNRELRAISNCNQVLVRAADEQTLLNEICSIICNEAGYCMAWVGYAENDDAKIIRPVAFAGREDGYLSKANITWDETQQGFGPSGTAIRTGKADCIQDFNIEPKAAPWRENALQRGYCSSIALPLKDENAHPFGVLNLYSCDPHTFTVDEKHLLEELSDNLAFGILSLRSRSERKRTESINTLRLHLIQFAETHSLDEILEETLNKTEEITGSRIGFYHFYDAERDVITLHAWSTRTKTMYCTAEGEGLHNSMQDAGVWADAARQRQPMVHNDFASLPHRKELPQGHPAVVRDLVVPVMRGGNVLAILGVGNKPTDYTEKDIESVAYFADFAWDVAERKKAEINLHKLNEELEQRVKDRTAELEKANAELYKMNRVFIGRELKMVELKGRIMELEKHVVPKDQI